MNVVNVGNVVNECGEWRKSLPTKIMLAQACIGTK